MSVKYNGNLIIISSENKNKNLLVYSHPEDNIKFNFDISSLVKKIINGDLIIYLLNGRTITLVNFGLMVLDNKAPILSDIKQTYNPFSLFDGSYYYEEDGVSPYVVSREISSPSNNVLPSGNQLPSAKNLFVGEGSSIKYIGETNESIDINNNDVSPYIQDYITKTLFSSFTKLEESMMKFVSNNKFKYNEPYSDIYPIKLLLINPKVVPEYGCGAQLLKQDEIHLGYKDLVLPIGGGKLLGNEHAYYMYTPEVIDLKSENSKIWFDGSTQSDIIIRWVAIQLPTPTITFDQVVISGLPGGVVVPKDFDNNLIVKQFGSTVEIKVKGSRSGVIEIPIQYRLGFGGEEGIYSPISINYQGTQSKTGDLVKGNVSAFLEFKPVRGAGDISNYDKFNTFTFSTLRDPLIIWFSSNDDVIKGGKGDYIYYGNAGDNKAYGGEGNEVFHLGTGNNSFYANLNNVVVDVDNSNNKNSLYLGDAISKVLDDHREEALRGKASVYTTINDGKIYFGGEINGKTFKTVATDFTYLYFNIGDKNEEKKVRDYTLDIISTKNLKNNINVYFGKGNHIVRGDDIPMVIEAKMNSDNINTIFIHTKDVVTGVFINWDEEGNSYIIGSLNNDTIIGNNDISIKFDGSGRGENTADYSSIAVGLTYDAATGVIVKEGNQLIDIVKGIKNFLGGLSKTIFYGAIYFKDRDGNIYTADINYFGSVNVLDEQNTLSYINLEKKSGNGVTVDLENSRIIKHGSNGIDRFFKIGNIQSSNNDDTFIISNDSVSRILDGLGGFNTINYSNLSVYTIFNIYENGPSTVQKDESGNFGIDTIRNFRHFIGSRVGSDFILKDVDIYTYNFFGGKEQKDFRFIIECKNGEVLNKVSYSNINGKSMILDLNPEIVTASIYSDSVTDSKMLAKDKLININNFFLSVNAKNIIYAYNLQVFSYTIDAGSGGDNILTFEKSKNSININFSNSAFGNLANINKLILSEHNDTIVMGYYSFAKIIDGFAGINKVDFSNIAGPLKLELDLLDLQFNVEILVNNFVIFKNFQQIISTFANDAYFIKFKLDDIEKIKGKNIFIDGNLGNNIIDFSKVEACKNDTNGLSIDLSGEFYIAKDIKGNEVLKFLNFNKIVGSQGNDIFILPKNNLFLDIDGGGGNENIVSYQSYTNGIYIYPGIFSKFKNIHKIVGSQGNDHIELDKDSSIKIDGYDGFNTLIYSEGINFDTLTVTISNIKLDNGNLKSLIKINKDNKALDELNAIGFINLENNIVTNGAEFFINNQDNTTLHKQGTLFLQGSKFENTDTVKSKIVYKEDLQDITLNLQVITSQIVKGSWINVVKGKSNNIDYLQNFSSITLSKKSTVNIFNNIGFLQNISTLLVDGREDSILSFEFYGKGGTLNVNELKFENNFTINFKNFTSFKASGLSGTKFKFISAENKNYTFYGLESLTTLSYEEMSKDITINISKDSSVGSTIYNSVVVNKGDTTDKAYNIINFVGSKGITKVIIDYNFNKNMTFTGNADKKSENLIDYQNLSEAITFDITGSKILVGRFFGEFYDVIVNINKIIGSKDSNYFRIANDAFIPNTVYELDGGGGGLNNISLVGVDYNLEYHLDLDGKINININNNKFVTIKNIHILFGSTSKNNNFKLGNFFEGKYFSAGTLQLYGNYNEQQDILDLQESKKGFSLDPLTGKIYETNNKKLELFTMKGISVIKLGDGNHQVDVSTKNSSVGWKEIIGGKGLNNISFDKYITSINYNLAEGVVGLSFKVKNFSGVTGSKNNDIFYLNENNIDGIRINGNGGNYNVLDYSKLNVVITVDLTSKKIIRGDKTDIVENISIYKSGSAGGTFIGIERDSCQFIASDSSNKNILDYSKVNSDLIFSFINSSVIKEGGNFDTFSNITEFVGGSGNNNTFLFTLTSISKKINEIVIDGGKGKNNTINLFQLETGITYYISENYFSINDKDIKLKVILKHINNIIGSSHGDIFILDDKVNGYSINGGNTNEGRFNTIDLSRVTNSVTIDFILREIVYGNNKNNFININKFIGSKAGGDIFKGLNSYTKYDLTGGAGGNNKVIYDNCTSAVTLKIEDKKVIIYKNSSVFDTLNNFQKIVLSNLSDILLLNNVDDLDVLNNSFKEIDGGVGDNKVLINFKIEDKRDFIINLFQNKIIYNNKEYNISFKNFRVWEFSKDVFNANTNYSIILADKDLIDLRSISFYALSNYLNGYYTTLDLSNAKSNFFLNINNSVNKNISIILNTSKTTNSILLNNVTKVILSEGNHNIYYNNIIYNGESSNASFILNVEASNAEKTEIVYYISSLINEVGTTYICIDGIKFAEKGTKYDIRTVGSSNSIYLDKLVSKKDNVVIFFDETKKLYNKSKPLVVYIKDTDIKDNAFVFKHNYTKEGSRKVNINILTENLVQFSDNGDRALNVVFLNANINKSRLMLTDGKKGDDYRLAFHTYKSAFSNILIKNLQVNVTYDFSEMDITVGGGGVYAIFDYWKGYSFYSHVFGSKPSEANKLFSVDYDNKQSINYKGRTHLVSSKYEDYYKLVVYNKYIDKGGADYNLSLDKGHNNLYSYTLEIDHVNLGSGSDLIGFQTLQITYQGIYIKGNINPSQKKYELYSITEFENDNNLLNRNIVFNFSENIFAKQLEFLFNFTSVSHFKIRNIILPEPSILEKYEKVTFDIVLNFWLPLKINSTTAIFNLKNNNAFANINVINSAYSLNIHNCSLTHGKFALASTAWMDVSSQYSSSVILQGDKDSNFLVFAQKNKNFQISVIHIYTPQNNPSKYIGIFDASNIYLGKKNDIPNNYKLVFNINSNDKELISEVYLDKYESTNHDIKLGTIINANSIKIQREDLTFATEVIFENFSTKNNRYNNVEIFNFGSMPKMKLPNNKDYQIFTKGDKFIPEDKRWKGNFPYKTYANNVRFNKLENDGSLVFDSAQNNRFSFTANNSDISGFNSLDLGKVSSSNNIVFDINSFTYRNPFVISIQPVDKYVDLNIRASAQPEGSVVLRILRDSSLYQGNQVLTFTNDYEYNNPNFQYYGSVDSKFNKITIEALNYTIKSSENRDKRFKDIPDGSNIAVNSIALTSGIYSFSDVDKGSLNYQNNEYHGHSAIIVFMKDPRPSIKSSEPTFYVTDSVMVRDAEGYNLNSFDVSSWLNALVNIVSQKATIYSGVRKFIITGNKSILPPTNQNTLAKEIPLRVFLDPRLFSEDADKSYVAIFQRDVFKGDPNNEEDVKKYVGDAVSFNADTLAAKFGGGIRYDSGILFSRNDVALSYNATSFLVKDMCFNTNFGSGTIKHDQGIIYGKYCKATTFVFGSDLQKPEFMSPNKKNIIFFDVRDKDSDIKVYLPGIKEGNDIFTNYKYKINLNKDDSSEVIYGADISILFKDFNNDSFKEYYTVKIQSTKNNLKKGIKIFELNNKQDHYEFIYNNYKNLYDLTLEGNDTKIDLDKVKDNATGLRYLTWENQQEYLNRFDKISAAKDYWDLIDQYIEESFNVTPINNMNDGTESFQLNSENKSLIINNNNFLNEEDDCVEYNINTNHSSIFESSFDENLEKSYLEEEHSNFNDNVLKELEEYLEDDNEEINNHSVQDDFIVEDPVEEKQDTTIEFKESINLSNLFETVKSISENIDNTTLVEEYGLSSLTLEELNHTYQEDEANSMSYTIDGCTNIASNCGNDYALETTTQENQKNKNNH